MDIQHLLILGIPQMGDPETEYGVPATYIVDLAEVTQESDDKDIALNRLMAAARQGTKLYLAEPITSGFDRAVLDDLLKYYPSFVIDEALEMLKQQIGPEILDPKAFECAVFDAQAKFLAGNTIEFTWDGEENESVFHEPGRPSTRHTVKWVGDGTIEVNGCVLRSTAIMAQGHFLTELLGDGVLTPAQVVGFIACRLAVNGVGDLLGYGRAFGPGKEDQTNATLFPRSRKFRAKGVVGVVAADAQRVSKAKPQMVVDTVEVLRLMFPDVPIFLHQQCKEFYWGDEAMEAFRASVTEDGLIQLGGKSTKHTRVDAGAYVLYTEAGDGTLDIPALLGMFEESNDGSLYCPKALLDTLGGYLKETVTASKDFKNMSQEMITRYYASRVLVKEGDTLYPGDPVFEVDGVVHTWESKADWGVVTGITNVATAQLVNLQVRLDAWFTGDLKVRGFGKGLVCSSEAAGIEAMVTIDGEEDATERMLVGVPGIVKDSFAAAEYILDPVPCVGIVTTQHCEQSFELMLQKHAPTEGEHGRLERVYDEVGVTLYFDPADRTVTTVDSNAIACTIRVGIEAAPVAQSVGTSAMTMPQLAWLSSFEPGNEYLKRKVLPGIKRRVNSLAYLHAVAKRMEVEA